MNVIEVEDLNVSIGGVPILRHVSLVIGAESRVGLIGESGSGKSLTIQAIMGILPDNASVTGSVRFEGRELLTLPERSMCELRGARMAVIVQEPMTALDPVMRVKNQVGEVLRIHGKSRSRKGARDGAVELLRRLEFDDPERVANAYPHQLSGGQRQRVMIAMAIACGPSLILADEPTTALDVTVQARVLATLDRVLEEEGSSLLLVSHDVAIVSGVCSHVAVMYGGRVVERGETASVLTSPRHPYTSALIETSGDLSGSTGRHAGQACRQLRTIPGVVPRMGQFPVGCGFRGRCPKETEHCREEPVLNEGDRAVACWHAADEIIVADA